MAKENPTLKIAIISILTSLLIALLPLSHATAAGPSAKTNSGKIINPAKNTPSTLSLIPSDSTLKKLYLSLLKFGPSNKKIIGNFSLKNYLASSSSANKLINLPNNGSININLSTSADSSYGFLSVTYPTVKNPYQYFLLSTSPSLINKTVLSVVVTPNQFKDLSSKFSDQQWFVDDRKGKISNGAENFLQSVNSALPLFNGKNLSTLKYLKIYYSKIKNGEQYIISLDPHDLTIDGQKVSTLAIVYTITNKSIEIKGFDNQYITLDLTYSKEPLAPKIPQKFIFLSKLNLK